MTLFGRSRPVREPFPDDFKLGSLRGRLGYADRNGSQLVSIAPNPKAVPDAYGESAKDPIFGANYAYRNFRGMGRRRQRGEFDGRVWYCLNTRTRPGYLCQGPALTSYTPATRDSTNGVSRFFEIASKVFAGDGRYVLDGSTDGTGWTVSKDLGASDRIYDVVVAQQSGGTRYALVGLGDSTAAQKFDGTTWSAWTSINARALLVTEDEILLADSTNRIRNCSLEADFTTAANWASSTARVGSSDHAINRLALTARGSLIVCKANDLYALDPQGDFHALFGERQFVPLSTNGEALGRWKENLYLTYAGASYALDPDGNLSPPIGNGALRDNGSECRGYETAWCGTDFFALAGLFNPDTGDSYLMEFTGEMVQNDRGQVEPVWHGSITAAFVGKKITALHQSTLGAPTGHKMAYIGFSDGTISKYVLACTPDPLDCDQERVSTDPGQCYLPRTYLAWPGSTKSLHNATGEADNFSSTNYATLSYRTDAASSYASIGSSFNSGERQVINFPDGAYCTFLDPLLTLTATADTASPQVSGLSIEWELRDPPKQVFQALILAEDNLRKRDGTPYRQSADEIRRAVEAMARLPTSVEWVDPEEESRQVTVKMPERTTAYDDLRKPRNAIQVLLVEQRENSTSGTYGRLSRYTYGALEAFTYGQLENQ